MQGAIEGGSRRYSAHWPVQQLWTILGVKHGDDGIDDLWEKAIIHEFCQCIKENRECIYTSSQTIIIMIYIVNYLLDLWKAAAEEVQILSSPFFRRQV